MFNHNSTGLFNTQNPKQSLNITNPIQAKTNPSQGIFFNNGKSSQSKNQRTLFENKQQKKGLFFTQQSNQTNQKFTTGSIFNKPSISPNNKSQGMFTNNIFKNQFKNSSSSPFKTKNQTQILSNKQKTQNIFKNNYVFNNPNNLTNNNANNIQPNISQNKNQNIAGLFQNMNLNASHNIPDTLTQQLKYSIMNTFQKLQFEKSNLIKENQLLTKRVQNLQNRNKELIDIINNLITQKPVSKDTNLNNLANTNFSQNNSAQFNPLSYKNQNQTQFNNRLNQFVNSINQLHNPLHQLSNPNSYQSNKINQNTNKTNTFNSNIISSVAINLFKQDNIQPIAYTQKIFITDDGYAIKAFITFNAFYSIKFIIIQQIQNKNGSFIFSMDDVLKNPLGTTLSQIQNNGHWFLFNPNSNFNIVNYDILQQIQPKIINSLKTNSKQWINLHINLQKWLILSNNSNQRVVVHHPEWKSSNCQIILFNYLNFNECSNDAKQVIKNQIEEWIRQTQKQNKQSNRNNVMYFDQTNGKLHMILVD